MNRGHRLRAAVCAVLALTLLGCARGCTSPRPPIHINPNMDWQPKAQAQEESEFFYDGMTMRQPVPGAIARGQLPPSEAWQTGRRPDGAFLAVSPVTDGPELAARGQRQYTIYCQPCHDKQGEGGGILYKRGNVPTTSMHEERIRDLPDGEIFDVITHGKGLMPGYGYPVPVADRWAIIAHVRRLQQQYQARDVAAAR